ncbi:ArsR/SmtB family transcription factor [Pontiella sulfatireligans]|uniref:Arsenic resistance transcriptional regulator ArsR1 n=1 Tax=Pontiella sulfatireligans TaxID=2750658 RepID=A0A6C2URB4_9BACT|nr:metalloregulator ArsR/SmtB family transcription factor [Pontiella sulfatireligans]VGO22862.1 Arsenic resistance transcriptional regulator ArsR1 [Pontiella sulfatireligans]
MNKPLEILKALSDRNRLRVVAALMHIDELCACQVVELLHVTGATASRHMGLLLHAGIVESRKDGRWVYYRLVDSIDPHLFQWLEYELKSVAGLEADRRLLETIVACEPEELCRRQRGEECCPNSFNKGK